MGREGGRSGFSIDRWRGELFGEGHLNHGVAVYGIRNLLRYGIATESRMESSRRECTFGDAIRLRRYHTR